jgi:predicted nucleic acid-binding protein
MTTNWRRKYSLRSQADTLVCNTGPLIALTKLQSVPLLSRLFTRVLVPSAVWQELHCIRSMPETITLDADALKLEIVDGVSSDPLLTEQLDAGEAAVLALVRSVPGSIALIDERKARQVATVVYGFPVLGTGGLLLRAKRQGLVPEIRPLFERLLAHGYYISEHIIEQICAEASETTLHDPGFVHRLLRTGSLAT